jgi:hypothetical protein
MKRAHVILGMVTLLAAAAPLAACGPKKPAVQLAKVSPGSLPAGETFKGVWYNEVWGYLHMVPNGNNVIGRWQSKQNGVWGKMTGTISGDVIKFDWEEHKAGAIGPSAIRRGKGYFKFVPKEPPDTPALIGEWGYGENEVGGGGWDSKKQKDLEPDLNSLKSDDDPTVDTGWDAPVGEKK